MEIMGFILLALAVLAAVTLLRFAAELLSEIVKMAPMFFVWLVLGVIAWFSLT